MSSVLSSRSRSCCPGALESVPGASIAGSRGGTVRAPRQKIAEAIPSRRPSSSTSTSTSAAAKKAPALLLPSLSLPKFSWSGGRLSKAKTKLMNLISKSDRGTNPSGPSREEVEAAIDELYAAAPRSALFPLENNPAGIDGKWKLVWTSEKEVLWVIANGERLFGVQEVGEVFQTLSLADDAGADGGEGEGKATPALVNEIVFPPGGSFIVYSDARARGPSSGGGEKETAGSRVDFKFSGARLDVAKINEATGECAPAFSLPLPPFGKGWFDTVVVGGDLRIARDVRGDTLICVRA